MTQADYERHLRHKIAEQVEAKFRSEIDGADHATSPESCCCCIRMNELLDGINDFVRGEP